MRAALCALCVLWCGLAGAQERALVTGVACVGEAVAPVAGLCMALELELSERPGRALADVDYLLNVHEDFDPQARVREARARCEGARAALEGGRARQASAEAPLCVEEALSLEPWLADRGLLEEALITRALVAHRGRRDRWEADEALVRLLNMSPGRGWLSRLPVELQGRLQGVEEGRRGVAPGSLEVTVEGAPAQVWLDGAPVGVTPARLEGLLVGEHLLRLERRGDQPRVEVVTVAPGERSSSRLSLSPSRLWSAWASAAERWPLEIGQPRVGGGLQELGALLYLDQVVALEAREGEVGLLLYDVRSGQLLAEVRRGVEGEGLEAWRGAVRAGLLELEGVLGRRAGDGEGEVEEEGAWWGSWWFWGGVGAVALGAAAVGWLWWGEGGEVSPPTTGALELTF